MKLRGLVCKSKVQKMVACLMMFMLMGMLVVVQPGMAGAHPYNSSTAAASLTIRVGYSGGIFTEAKVFTDSDFTGAVQQSFSFMDSMPSPCMDAVTGIPLADLLSKAGIDFNKVNSLTFYTTDVPDKPCKTFTKSYMYSPRYYYPNEMKYWNPNSQSFTAEDSVTDATYKAVEGAVQVYPMICISDNWVRGAMAPDFSAQDNSTKYRLVLGQTSDPATINAPDALRWVNQINVTLSGSPDSGGSVLDGSSSVNPVTGVSLNKTTDVINAGSTDQLTATIAPAYAANQTVTWSSNNATVATVSSTGLVTAVAPGSANITVTTADGGKSAVCTITVNPVAVNSTAGEAAIDPVVGGTISLGSDVSLNIPAGALNGTTGLSVAIRKVSNPPSPPTGFMLLGSVFEFTVGDNTGYSFAKPVTLTFTFSPSTLTNGETPSVYYYDQTSSKWLDLGGSISGNNISVTVNHFNKYAVYAVNKTVSTPVVQNSSNTLNDINGHWAENSIKKLVALGAIGGYPDGSFKPDETITRAEFATILVKAFKLNLQSGKVFADTNGHWAQEYVSSAASYGIVSGYDDSTFGPDDLITREQMAVMIIKAAGLTPAIGATQFADGSDISSWAGDAVASAIENGVMKGYPDNTFQPQGNATRAEAVTAILNALK